MYIIINYVHKYKKLVVRAEVEICTLDFCENVFWF